jgi:hypothetical protein
MPWWVPTQKVLGSTSHGFVKAESVGVARQGALVVTSFGLRVGSKAQRGD